MVGAHLSQKRTENEIGRSYSHRLIIGLPLLAAVVFSFGFSLMQPSEREIREGAARQTSGQRQPVNHSQLSKDQLEQQPALSTSSSGVGAAPTKTASPQTAGRQSANPQSSQQTSNLAPNTNITVKVGNSTVTVTPHGGVLGTKKVKTD